MDNPIATWGGWIGMIFTLIMYFLFPGRRKEMDKFRKEITEANKELTDTLERNIDALKEDSAIKDQRLKRSDDKIIVLQKQQQENILEINKIKESRDNIREILEARDKHTQDFQLKALSSFNLSMQTYEIVKVQNENLKALLKSIETNNDITKELIKAVIK